MTNSPDRKRTVKLPRTLVLFAVIVIVLWAQSLLFAFASSHPVSSFDGFAWIYYSGPAFDYYDYIGRMYYLHTPEFFSHPGYAWYYPAASVFPLQFFYAIGRFTGDWLGGYLSYIALAIAGTVFAAARLSLAMERRGVSRLAARSFLLSAALFSWPIYFSLQRGNIEAVTWLILAAALWAYGKERWLLAAVLLGVVSAFKFYPALCFALFLSARRWRELGAGLLTMGAVTLAALRYLLPDVGVAMADVAEGMTRWTNDYARGYGPQSATYDHSFYELVKATTSSFHPNYATFMERYLLVAGVIALAVFFGRVIRLPRTNQVLFLVSASVFLPPASFDYTLQNLYVPFGWLVLVCLTEAKRGVTSKPVACSLLLLAFLCGPETFVMWHDMTAAGLLKGVLLLALIIVSIVFPMGDIGPAGARERTRLTYVQKRLSRAHVSRGCLVQNDGVRQVAPRVVVSSSRSA